MKEQIEKRLNELKTEFESGQKILADLDAKRENIQNSLLRISGAIQVLEEELNRFGGNEKQTVQEQGVKNEKLVNSNNP